MSAQSADDATAMAALLLRAVPYVERALDDYAWEGEPRRKAIALADEMRECASVLLDGAESEERWEPLNPYTASGRAHSTKGPSIAQAQETKDTTREVSAAAVDAVRAHLDCLASVGGSNESYAVAILAALADAGLVVVPRVPTDAMIDAMLSIPARPGMKMAGYREWCRERLAAALSAAATGGDELSEEHVKGLGPLHISPARREIIDIAKAEARAKRTFGIGDA